MSEAIVQVTRGSIVESCHRGSVAVTNGRGDLIAYVGNPDFVTYIYKCPWHTQFQEMGLIEGGDTYCADLDKSICQGFNPHIVYEVDQTLHKSPYCIHRVRNSGLTPQSDRSKKMEYVHSFEYHCAHSYWSYSEVSRAIFGQEGAVVAQKVMEDFEQTYGKEMADALRGYEHTNFNVAD